MNKSLYHIASEYMMLASVLEDNGGEITPEIEEQLAINQEQLQTKGINYALVVRQLAGEAEVIDKEIERLTKLKKAKISSADRLKNTLKSAMELYQIESIKGDLINISLRKTPSSVHIDSEDKIPEKYIITEEVKKPNKKALKEALESGEEIEGVTLKTDGKSILIK